MATGRIDLLITYGDDSDMVLVRYALNRTMRLLREEIADATGFEVGLCVTVTPSEQS